MKRDTTGKFVRNWDDETKQRVSVTLTATAWQLLDEQAKKRNISRSEMIEQMSRSFDQSDLLSQAEQQSGQKQSTGESIETESTCAELALQKAKRKVVSILESISDAFVAFDRNWHYTYVNQAAAQLLQKKPEELLGRHVWNEVFPNLVGQLQYQELHRAVSEQVAVSWEEWDESTQQWLEVNAYPTEEGIAVYFRDITERKHAEVILQESEEKLRLFIQQAPVSVAMLDKRMHYVSASQRWVDFHKLDSIEAVIGRSHYELLPNLPENWKQVHQRCLTGATERCDEDVFVPIDGSTQYLRWEVQPWYISSGNIGGIIVFLEDITEQKQAEQALRLSENRYRMLSNAVPQLMWTNAPDGTVEFFNQRWLEYTGLPLELNLKRWTQFIHPEDAPFILKTRTRAIRAGEAYEMEVRLRRFDQVYRWHLARVVPLKDETGQVLQWFGTATDIDHVKQTEAALRQSEERLRVAIQDSPIVVFNQDQDLRYTWVYNPAFISAADILGKSDSDFASSEDAMKLTQIKRQVLETGTGIREEVRLTIAEAIYYYDLTIEPLRDAKDIIVGITCAAFDITDRKCAEQEREQILFRERTAREEAETANRIKDEFLAILSHELRSPLNPILGWAKLLQTRKFDAAATKRALETIERNARLQTQLIEDLLDVSRILRGKMSLNVCAVDLVTVIDAALDTIRLSAEAKAIEVQFTISKTELQNQSRTKSAVQPVFQVWGDASRLQQIVWNLLSNAVKFTPAKGRITVRLEQVDGDAQIQVSDTGKGIAPEFLPYVFEYFRQEDSTLTRQFGGLGLGLAIVRYLTELHGGTVAAASLGKGLGATFTVCLPLLKTKAKLLPALPSSPAAPLTQLRVLVVDDEADMRELMIVVLEQSGAEVKIAASAAEALSAFDSFKPDILISDIGMPEMDGYGLMQQVRRLSPEQGGRIQAIALSAYAGEYDQQRALASGFQQHISKPVDPEELVRAIAGLVNR